MPLETGNRLGRVRIPDWSEQLVSICIPFTVNPCPVATHYLCSKKQYGFAESWE